jgi:hypothetical protein
LSKTVIVIGYEWNLHDEFINKTSSKTEEQLIIYIMHLFSLTRKIALTRWIMFLLYTVTDRNIPISGNHCHMLLVELWEPSFKSSSQKISKGAIKG